MGTLAKLSQYLASQASFWTFGLISAFRYVQQGRLTILTKVSHLTCGPWAVRCELLMKSAISFLELALKWRCAAQYPFCPGQVPTQNLDTRTDASCISS